MEMTMREPPGDWVKLRKLTSREWQKLIQNAKKRPAAK
jgi:hypothetical protein